MKRLISLLLTLGILLFTISGTSAASEREKADRYLVKFKNPPDEAPFHIVSARELDVLLTQQALEWYEPDDEIPLDEPAAASPTLRAAVHSWALDMIHADSAVQAECAGQGVRVGVIDSGINPHEDLAENLVPGACYISDASVSDDTTDNYGHGTKVAGLIAGHNAEFNTGAAPGATLVPLKCTDGRAVKVSAICRAVYAGVDDYDCDLLNLSLGVTKNYEALGEAIAYAQSKGVLVVAAVGNSGNAAVYYPAGFEGVLGVGAVDASGAIYSKSNRGDAVFLSAPGVDVLTTHFSGGYTTATGTSFAAPLVTAAAADLMSAAPSLSADTISALLQSGAADAGPEGWDNAYGHGIVDVAAGLLALQALQDEPEDPEPFENPFLDVADDRYYYDAVLWAYRHDPQITAGTSATTFSPNDGATRAQIVTFLWKAAGSPEPGQGSGIRNPEPEGEEDVNPFADVTEDKYYYKAVMWAAENGITSGTSANTFTPDRICTRAEVVTFLYRFAGSPEVDDAENPFSDVPNGKYYAKPVLWAYYRDPQITAGTSETTFSPKDDCTRGQVVTFLYHLA